MAPEQVEGRDADARCDIWALGAVLYEMVTGRRPFDGESPASVIGSILKDQAPRPSMRQPVAPPALDHIVECCLRKDPDQRWQNAGDLRQELVWIAENGASAAAPAAPRTVWLRPVSGWVAAALLAAGLGTILSLPRPGVEGGLASPAMFTISPAPGTMMGQPLATVATQQFAVSPDGAHVVFVASDATGVSRLYLRSLSGVGVRPLPATEQASYPFWSPDSREIAFFTPRSLKKTRDMGSR
jgi:serine/threonine-protein kinase